MKTADESTVEEVEGQERGAPVDPKESPHTIATTNQSNPPARFWIGLVAGGIVAVPLAKLLSLAVTLPFFLGVFFFALFGLVIGAVVHRVAAPGRPYGRSAVVLGTTVLTAGVWLTALVLEAQSLPIDVADYAADRTRNLSGLTRVEYEQRVASEVRDYLRRHYGEGTTGYVRWALTSGSFETGDIPTMGSSYGGGQQRWVWGGRVAVTVVLLAFGIASQTFALRLERDPIVRSKDASE